MSRNRLMLLVAVVASFAVAAAGFFLGVQPQLDRASAAHEELATTSGQNDTSRAELARLKEQAEALPEMRADLATLRSSVPGDADTSPFIKQVGVLADNAGVQVSTITVGDAAAYAPPAAAATSGSTESEPSASASASASATPTPTPSSTAQAAPKTTTNSAITSSNFAVIPVSVSVNGEFSQALSFVKGLQSSPRLFLIDSVSSASANGGDSDSSDAADKVPAWTFSGFVYVLHGDTSSTTTTATASNG